jgi:hypothetical protein
MAKTIKEQDINATLSSAFEHHSFELSEEFIDMMAKFAIANANAHEYSLADVLRHIGNAFDAASRMTRTLK